MLDYIIIKISGIFYKEIDDNFSFKLYCIFIYVMILQIECRAAKSRV